MIILATGATHTGKTYLAQQLLLRTGYPVLSLDLLKMGLIKSGHTNLTVSDDQQMTGLLWPIVREMVKTAIENHQHLIVEGCYIPSSWQEDFLATELSQIHYVCLACSDWYIRSFFDTIMEHANVIEQRKDDSQCTQELLLSENKRFRDECAAYHLPLVLVDGNFEHSINEALEVAISCPCRRARCRRHGNCIQCRAHHQRSHTACE